MKRILEIQMEIGSLSKKSNNPFFKSAYLDLNDLLNNIVPLLNAKGLVLTQPLEEDTVCSVIMDAESGEAIVTSFLKLPENLTDPQKIGSCITYFRRYTLKSLLAISEVDDDGNLASKPTKYIKTILSDENINNSIAKGTQKEVLIGISQGKFSATPEQIKNLEK
jgi:hypothetical protein